MNVPEHHKDTVYYWRDQTMEYPKAYGTYDTIHFFNPPLSIRLNDIPKDSVLFFGPWLGLVPPIPVIPWPPGIVDAFRSPSISTDEVHVDLNFTYWNKETVGPYTLNPQQVKLISDHKTFTPISISTRTYDCFGKTSGFVENAGDQLSIRLTAVGPCQGVGIDLVFGIAYSDIRSALLEIGDVGTPHGTVPISSTTIAKKRKIKLFLIDPL